MTLRKKLLPTFNNPVSGQTASCNLPLGQKLHTIHLQLSDFGGTLLAALVGEIRLLVNGKVQRRMLASELDDINASNGTIYAAQTSGTAGPGAGTPATASDYVIRLPIFLAEPWRKTNMEAATLGWNLAGPTVTSASIEVDFLSGITSPAISGWYEWSPPDGGLGAITKWIRQTFGASGTQQDFNTLTRADFYHAIHLFPPTGAYVDKVRLTADGVVIQDTLDAKQNQVMLIHHGMNPDTSGTPRFDLVLDADDPINSALLTRGLNEFTLHVEYSAAATGNLVALIEQSGPPE
jgi:hypothetical protein